MYRRHTSGGYDDHRDDPRDPEGRASRNPRDTRHSRDTNDHRQMEDIREQPIIRDLREQRYPRDERRFSESADYGDRTEIQTARSARDSRDSRGPRYTARTRVDSHVTDPDHSDPRDRMSISRTTDQREITESGDIAGPRHDRRNAGGVRYHPDRRQSRDELYDPTPLNPEREDRNPRSLRLGREYQATDPSNIRNDLTEHSPVNYPDSTESTLAASGRLNEFFLPAEGISREVLVRDIGSHLGSDATIRPGSNQQGLSGYIIKARRRFNSDMISDLKAESTRWDSANRQRGGRDGRTEQADRSHNVAEEHGGQRPASGRLPYATARDYRDYPVTLSPTGDYPTRSLFDHSERMYPAPASAGRDPREGRHHPSDQTRAVVDSSRFDTTSLSRSSTYDSSWSGSLGTRGSSRSSHSTAPSSVQSMSDDRHHQSGYALQYPPRRSHSSQYSRGFQPTSQPFQSHPDPRISDRAPAAAARPEAHPRPGARSAMQPPDDDPPDWEETPNFRGFVRGP